jgi:hypothetical protein
MFLQNNVVRALTRPLCLMAPIEALKKKQKQETKSDGPPASDAPSAPSAPDAPSAPESLAFDDCCCECKARSCCSCKCEEDEAELGDESGASGGPWSYLSLCWLCLISSICVDDDEACDLKGDSKPKKPKEIKTRTNFDPLACFAPHVVTDKVLLFSPDISWSLFDN